MWEIVKLHSPWGLNDDEIVKIQQGITTQPKVNEKISFQLYASSPELKGDNGNLYQNFVDVKMRHKRVSPVSEFAPRKRKQFFGNPYRTPPYEATPYGATPGPGGVSLSGGDQ